MAERPDQREAFARFEFLTDRRMAQLPVSALCAYDLSRLDAAGAPAFTAAIRRICPLTTGDEVVIDASELDYISNVRIARV